MTQRGEILYTPDATRVGQTQMREFAGSRDFEALHKWSISRPEDFWASVWDYCAVAGERGERVIQRTEFPSDPSREFISTKFFPDAKLSVVDNFLRHTAPTAPSPTDRAMQTTSSTRPSRMRMARLTPSTSKPRLRYNPKAVVFEA